MLLRVLGVLLVVWLVVAVLGAVLKGLFWLAVVVALFVAVTALTGWNKHDQRPLPPNRR